MARNVFLIIPLIFMTSSTTLYGLLAIMAFAFGKMFMLKLL